MPVTKSHILHESTQMTYEKFKLREAGSKMAVARGWGKWEMGSCSRAIGFSQAK